ncbi:MAG: hypothetical protein WAT19_06395 [Ferruginibacter sp.]
MRNQSSILKLLFLIVLTCKSVLMFAQPTTWLPRGVGGGGSMFFPSINPANDNEYYVTCDMSQLFRSTDFGNSYTQVPFSKLQTGSISSYEFTNNSNTAYCIANDGNINYAVRTLDGGNTWNALPGNPLAGEDVYALKADYNNPSRIIIGYYGSLYISNNQGLSFTLIKNAADAGSGITVGGVFFDGNNIYIGTNEGLLFSSNGGNSFSVLPTTGIPANQKIFSLAAAKSGTTTRFFCITATDVYNGIFPWEYYGFAQGVFSMDAGTNVWTIKSSGINFSSDFVMYAGMARNDINTVYLGGSDGITGGNLVFKTSNAGNSWNKVFLTNNNQNVYTGWSGQGGDRGWGYGETCFGITVAPNNANKVLIGDFGFVHKTNDGGASWKQAYVNPADENPVNTPTPPMQYYRSSGLENTSAWQVHWQDANNMFACFSDIRGIRSEDAGNSWGFNYTGHTANTMYRISRRVSGSTLYAATSGIHDMYQSTRLQDNILDANDAAGSIIYSANNGAAWQLLHQFNHPVFWLAADPTNVNRLYASVVHYGGGAGQGGIWKTENLDQLGSSVWSKLSNPPRTEGHPASIIVLNDGKVLCTFSGRRNSSGTFTASSGVFIYDPNTASWTDLSHSGMLYWTKDIVVDPSDATQSTWYVCVFSGWGGAPNGLGGLYRTTNRGSTWTKLTGTQFDRVTSISFNPQLLSQAYLTTEMQGLWISSNMNTAVPSWSLVNNYPFRQPERVFFNPFNNNEIWVTSFGNGLKMGTSVVLPVKLISFSAYRSVNNSILNWTTGNEDTGDRFEVERSTNGRQFDIIGSIAGKGSIYNEYRFSEAADFENLYYRIKIISAAGRETYSRMIHFSETNSNFVQLLQNPVPGIIKLSVSMAQQSILHLCLVDMEGKIVLRKGYNLPAGQQYINIPLEPNLPEGTYMLHVQNRNLEKSLKLILKN